LKKKIRGVDDRFKKDEKDKIKLTWEGQMKGEEKRLNNKKDMKGFNEVEHVPFCKALSIRTSIC
jgi:hypothetical protein